MNRKEHKDRKEENNVFNEGENEIFEGMKKIEVDQEITEDKKAENLILEELVEQARERIDQDFMTLHQELARKFDHVRDVSVGKASKLTQNKKYVDDIFVSMVADYDVFLTNSNWEIQQLWGASQQIDDVFYHVVWLKSDYLYNFQDESETLVGELEEHMEGRDKKRYIGQIWKHTKATYTTLTQEKKKIGAFERRAYRWWLHTHKKFEEQAFSYEKSQGRGEVEEIIAGDKSVYDVPLRRWPYMVKAVEDKKENNESPDEVGKFSEVLENEYQQVWSRIAHGRYKQGKLVFDKVNDYDKANHPASMKKIAVLQSYYRLERGADVVVDGDQGPATLPYIIQTELEFFDPELIEEAEYDLFYLPEYEELINSLDESKKQNVLQQFTYIYGPVRVAGKFFESKIEKAVIHELLIALVKREQGQEYVIIDQNYMSVEEVIAVHTQKIHTELETYKAEDQGRRDKHFAEMGKDHMYLSISDLEKTQWNVAELTMRYGSFKEAYGSLAKKEAGKRFADLRYDEEELDKAFNNILTTREDLLGEMDELQKGFEWMNKATITAEYAKLTRAHLAVWDAQTSWKQAVKLVMYVDPLDQDEYPLLTEVLANNQKRGTELEIEYAKAFLEKSGDYSQVVEIFANTSYPNRSDTQYHMYKQRTAPEGNEDRNLSLRWVSMRDLDARNLAPTYYNQFKYDAMESWQNDREFQVEELKIWNDTVYIDTSFIRQQPDRENPHKLWIKPDTPLLDHLKVMKVKEWFAYASQVCIDYEKLYAWRAETARWMPTGVSDRALWRFKRPVYRLEPSMIFSHKEVGGQIVSTYLNGEEKTVDEEGFDESFDNQEMLVHALGHHPYIKQSNKIAQGINAHLWPLFDVSKQGKNGPFTEQVVGHIQEKIRSKEFWNHIVNTQNTLLGMKEMRSWLEKTLKALDWSNPKLASQIEVKITQLVQATQQVERFYLPVWSSPADKLLQRASNTDNLDVDGFGSWISSNITTLVAIAAAVLVMCIPGINLIAWIMLAAFTTMAVTEWITQRKNHYQRDLWWWLYYYSATPLSERRRWKMSWLSTIWFYTKAYIENVVKQLLIQGVGRFIIKPVFSQFAKASPWFDKFMKTLSSAPPEQRSFLASYLLRVADEIKDEGIEAFAKSINPQLDLVVQLISSWKAWAWNVEHEVTVVQDVNSTNPDIWIWLEYSRDKKENLLLSLKADVKISNLEEDGDAITYTFTSEWESLQVYMAATDVPYAQRVNNVQIMLEESLQARKKDEDLEAPTWSGEYTKFLSQTVTKEGDGEGTYTVVDGKWWSAKVTESAELTKVREIETVQQVQESLDAKSGKDWDQVQENLQLSDEARADELRNLIASYLPNWFLNSRKNQELFEEVVQDCLNAHHQNEYVSWERYNKEKWIRKQTYGSLANKYRLAEAALLKLKVLSPQQRVDCIRHSIETWLLWNFGMKFQNEIGKKIESPLQRTRRSIAAYFDMARYDVLSQESAAFDCKLKTQRGKVKSDIEGVANLSHQRTRNVEVKMIDNTSLPKTEREKHAKIEIEYQYLAGHTKDGQEIRKPRKQVIALVDTNGNRFPRDNQSKPYDLFKEEKKWGVMHLCMNLWDKATMTDLHDMFKYFQRNKDGLIQVDKNQRRWTWTFLLPKKVLVTKNINGKEYVVEWLRDARTGYLEDPSTPTWRDPKEVHWAKDVKKTDLTPDHVRRLERFNHFQKAAYDYMKKKWCFDAVHTQGNKSLETWFKENQPMEFELFGQKYTIKYAYVDRNDPSSRADRHREWGLKVENLDHSFHEFSVEYTNVAGQAGADPETQFRDSWGHDKPGLYLDLFVKELE